ncbi:uncharacterized protein N7498_004970 [Penicillium cinerascens]|uniref:Uncharacterized protein n=1 Tax=Penicillium cinerascens TaxID=70096 RepID=A0A9W9MMJ1_9EURO|nr:uncharacterized protein N7498_004970 [Penicillium cinerascens]KAJ5204091.1 hypothetical protein N7498_004970 [Penicillium cinerascens]
MESTDNQNHAALQPLAPDAVQETSPEPVKSPVKSPVNAEFPLVALLTQGLEECDWEQLQKKYADAMDEHSRVEEDLRIETAKLLEIFTAWSQTTVLQDEQRALKRHEPPRGRSLKSNASNAVQVQDTDAAYTEVVKAFQSALALLNEQLKT